MALPASEQWIRIQKEITGKANSEQIAIIRRHLDNWPDEWKGPYRELKEKLTKMLKKLETVESVKSSTSRTDSFHIRHEGDGQISIIGLTNSGKSAIVSTLTQSRTEITDYPFATQVPLPGVLNYSGAVIQILDTPAIVRGLSEGEGPGQKLLQLIRGSDAVGIVIDLSQNPIDQMNTIVAELSTVQINLLGGPVGTILRIKGKGGVVFSGQALARDEQILAHKILADANIKDAEVLVNTVFSETELLAQISKCKLMPSIVIGNKNDTANADANLALLRQSFSELNIIDVNFLDETHFDELREYIFKVLGLIKIHLLEKPILDSKATLMAMPCSTSIEQLAKKSNLNRGEVPYIARVWGDFVKFPGQSVGTDYLVHEGDRIHIQQ